MEVEQRSYCSAASAGQSYAKSASRHEVLCHRGIAVPDANARRRRHRALPRRARRFLRTVGAWNFVGAGIFEFLINLPIVSYFDVGTLLTVNHGHAAMMGVFGMLAIALMVFAVRHVSTEPQWNRLEIYFKIAFWGLNVGLLMIVVFSLFPGGVLQLMDVLENGYWHARSLNYAGQETAQLIEWLRMPGDLVFIFIGVVPALIAVARCYFNMWTGMPVLEPSPATEGSGSQ